MAAVSFETPHYPEKYYSKITFKNWYAKKMQTPLLWCIHAVNEHPFIELSVI